MLEFCARLTFRHPLIRAAVYQAAPIADRRLAHQAIAEATDPGTDPDHRAWHRAQAAPVLALIAGATAPGFPVPGSRVLPVPGCAPPGRL